MYLIPIEKLKAGDILLTSENSATSKVVRKSTKSDFSHAILYVGSGSYIHSDANGVHSGNIQRLLFDGTKNVTVLTVECDKQVIEQACLFARSKIGMQYSVKSAVNAKVKISNKQNLNRQFCSRLVAQAYNYAGLKIVDDPAYCTPQEILESSVIREINGYVRQANEKEIEFAESENPIEKQSAITNYILSNVRKISQDDIQTFEQITEYVISHPEHDKEISRIYKDSGYLTMWEHELGKNAWRYNRELFFQLPMKDDELVALARFERENAQERLALYKNNLEKYYYINEIHKMEYSKIHFNLYKQLVEIAIDNVVAAEYVLDHT